MTLLSTEPAQKKTLNQGLRKDDGDEEEGDESEDEEDGQSRDEDDEGEEDDAFNAQHPRWPAGSPGGIGGEFAPKGSGSGDTSSMTDATAQNITQQLGPVTPVSFVTTQPASPSAASTGAASDTVIPAGGVQVAMGPEDIPAAIAVAETIATAARLESAETATQAATVSGETAATTTEGTTAESGAGTTTEAADTQTTEHGTARAAERDITDDQIQEAMQTAEEAGQVTTQMGKYGTPQKVYQGTNGVTVVVETTGRSAGKIITLWSK